MNNGITFTAGLGVGSLIAWCLAKNKYSKIADEEIESVKRVYSNQNKPEEPDTKKVVSTLITTTNEAIDIIADEGYDPDASEKSTVTKSPYLIDALEYGEYEEEDYESLTMTLYQDGVLVHGTSSSKEDIISEPEYYFGSLYPTIKKELEGPLDSVYVRDDENKKDFEILKDYRLFHLSDFS